MLYDKDFLLKLDKDQHKVIYARVTALTFQETPIEYIEGRVTQGSINLDGASAVRRSCSLTIAAPEFNYNDFYWGLNTKFKLEIGVENNIDLTYPNIIWFNQGIYLITSFNTARNTSSFNITIQGKDKMCLLNGEIGGSLESSVDFGTIEEEDINGLWTTKKLSIQEIIKNIVHTYGGEPYHNIIINDLDTYGLELLEYRYDVPLFLYKAAGPSPIYDNALLEGSDILCSVYDKNNILVNNDLKDIPLSEVPDRYFENLTDTLINLDDSYKFKIENKYYNIVKIVQFQTAGYRKTDLVYAGDLIANVGESITSILDKIKTMLTEFEYFYNLDGQFVFQKKQSFKETIWQNNENEIQQRLNESLAHSTKHAYEFHGGNFITAFNNNPNLLNLRNDFSIWGERDGVSGAKIPIHLRYAIDKKPTRYTKITVKCENVDDPDYQAVKEYNDKYNTIISGQESSIENTFIAGEDCDWREVIYQMALDYYRYNFLDDFELRVAAANPIDYPTGRTGYEQYYIDLQAFWRELYYPNIAQLFEKEDKQFIPTEVKNLQVQINNLTDELYGIPQEGYINNIGGIENDLVALNNAPFKDDAESGEVSKFDLMTEWWNDSTKKDYWFYLEDEDGNNEPVNEDEDLYLGMLNDLFFRKKEQLETLQYRLEQAQIKFEDLHIEDYYYDSSDLDKKYWNKKVFEAPEQLNFWFDFLDNTGELAQFSVKSVGARPKAINDNNIKSIYFRETPDVIYQYPGEVVKSEAGFRYIQVPNANHMFTCSAQGKSAKNKLDELLYQHSYCIESATITSIPIYYLEPNTRIYLHDEETGLDGDYIISKITIPLSYNGTMSITATKAAENIL